MTDLASILEQNRVPRQVNGRYADLLGYALELRVQNRHLLKENRALRQLLAASGVHVHPSEAAMATGPRTTPQSASGRRPAETGGHRDLRDPSTTEETE